MKKFWLGWFVFGLSAISAQAASLPPAKTLEFRDKIRVCGLLANPGDFLLQNLGGKSAAETFGSTNPKVGKWTAIITGIKELLSLHDVYMTYYHAEMLTKINKGYNLISWSFYPPFFQDFWNGRGGDLFRRYSSASIQRRSNFSVFRTKGWSWNDVTEKREDALARVEVRDEEFNGRGVCSDFINWAYREEFTSWWNFIPLVRRVISKIYPFEALSTPDDLADSPYSKKVCELKNVDELIYPGWKCTQDLVNEHREGLDSKTQEQQKHSAYVLGFLENEGLIDSDLNIIIPRVDFLEPPNDHQLLSADLHCRQCKRSQSRHRGVRKSFTRRALSPACKASCETAKRTEC